MTPSPPGRGDVARTAHVYLLRSMKDGMFYTGWTTDVQRRLAQHNSGGVPSTRAKRPFQLVSAEVFSSIAEAKRRERTLKRNPKMLRNFKKRMRNCAAATMVGREGMG